MIESNLVLTGYCGKVTKTCQMDLYGSRCPEIGKQKILQMRNWGQLKRSWVPDQGHGVLIVDYHWELSFGLEKLFECFFLLWFRYDFVMVLLWFRYGEKYGLVMVSKCYIRGIWFSIWFLYGVKLPPQSKIVNVKAHKCETNKHQYVLLKRKRIRFLRLKHVKN